jgi:hypothetical protein
VKLTLLRVTQGFWASNYKNRRKTMYLKKSRDESLFRISTSQIKAPKHKSLKNITIKTPVIHK